MRINSVVVLIVKKDIIISRSRVVIQDVRCNITSNIYYYAQEHTIKTIISLSLSLSLMHNNNILLVYYSNIKLR